MSDGMSDDIVTPMSFLYKEGMCIVTRKLNRGISFGHTLSVSVSVLYFLFQIISVVLLIADSTIDSLRLITILRPLPLVKDIL